MIPLIIVPMYILRMSEQMDETELTDLALPGDCQRNISWQMPIMNLKLYCKFY